MLQDWIQAFRLRTLPLALAGIAMGSFLAASAGKFSFLICSISCLTAIFLQVLSNLANDYGDTLHGADHDERQGPARMVQAGKITPKAMQAAIALCALLAFGAGLGLLWISLQTWQDFAVFLGLGLLSIVAAVTYTMGKKPYGYAGLGDLSVFIFFGAVAVSGVFYLYTTTWQWIVLLPASSSGLLAVGVLNLNNIRDIESDQKAGKKSIPVRIGRSLAITYHTVLLVAALAATTLYVSFTWKSPWQLLFLITLPLFFQNIRAVQQATSPAAVDPYLKHLALSTLLFVLLFGIGQLISVH